MALPYVFVSDCNTCCRENSRYSCLCFVINSTMLSVCSDIGMQHLIVCAIVQLHSTISHCDVLVISTPTKPSTYRSSSKASLETEFFGKTLCKSLNHGCGTVASEWEQLCYSGTSECRDIRIVLVYLYALATYQLVGNYFA